MPVIRSLKILFLLPITMLLLVNGGIAQQKTQKKAATLMVLQGVTKITVNEGETLTIEGGLTIGSGGEIDNAGTIEVSGTWDNLGTFDKRTGIVILTDDGGKDDIKGINFFNDLTITNVVGANIVSGVQSIWGTLKLSAGDFDVTGDSLILLSDSIGTARVAEIAGGATMTGDFTMQRYIDGDDGWRLLSSPVFGDTLGDWKDDFAMSGFPGSDDPASSFTSVWTYDETHTGVSDSGYVEPSSTADVLITGKGYMCWVGESLGVPIAITVDLTDSLTSGTKAITVSYTAGSGNTHDGWNLIGNPFASDIYWDSVSLSGSLTSFAYIYNPITDSYETFDNSSGRTIPSHQGFWVKVDSVSGTHTETVTIEEKDKAPDGDNFLKVGQTNRILLTLTSSGFINSTEIRFRQGATENYDSQNDAFKLLSLNPDAPNLSSVSADAIDLSINGVPELLQDFSIPIRVTWSYPYPPYHLGSSVTCTLSLNELPNMLSNVCLEDLSTGAFINLETGFSYSFTISDTAYAPRFLLHGQYAGCSTSIVEEESLAKLVEIAQTNNEIWARFNLLKPTRVQIEVYSLLGQAIWAKSLQVHQENVNLDLPKYSTGVYFIKINMGNAIFKRKIMLNN